MGTLRSLVIAAGLASLGAPVHAHHSFAVFDAENPLTLTGVVAEFRWVNPHSWVVLRVTDDGGAETDWELEQGPINMLSRQGWTPTTLEPGDAISVLVHPLHSGEPGGRFISYELAGGGTPELEGRGTITTVERPDPVPMSDAVARDFNGLWLNANGGIHFDTQGSATRRGQTPPLRPEYMARWQQRWSDADAGLATTDPTAECLPPGFPRFLTMVLPGEILQADHQLNWYAEFGEATIRVHLDGREPPADLYPSYNGFTTGEWDGNTLVTRTIGLRADTLVDTTGVPHSGELTVTMHLTKVTPDYFEADVTLDDAAAFTEPWRTVKRYARAPPEYYVQEYACEEGNRYRAGDAGDVERVFE
jgi:hypothetical protein